MKTWPTKKLGEIAKVFAGSSAPQAEKYFENGKYPFVRVSDLNGGKTKNLIDTRDQVNDLAVQELRLTKAKRGSVLFPKSGAAILTNSRAILGVDAYIVSHLAVIEADEFHVLPDYLFLFLSNFDMCKLVSDPAYPSLRLSDVRELEIPLPPLEEQKRIVEKIEKLFAKIDEASRLRAQSLAASAALLPSALHQVFSRAEKEGWLTKKLGEVCEVVAGGTPSTAIPDYWNGDILWVTPKDLGILQNLEISNTERKITKAGLENSSAKLLSPGAVILSTRAPIGHLAIATKPMATNQGCKAFICNKEVHNRYLYWVLKQNVDELRALGSGATFTEISKKVIENFEIPLPPLSEQKKIVAYLDALSQKMRELQNLQSQTVSDFSTLRQSVLARTFTGGL